MAQVRDSNHLTDRIEDLRAEIRGADPSILASRTGTDYTHKKDATGVFCLQFWDRSVQLSYPELHATDTQTGEALSAGMLALVLYYFKLSDSTPTSGRWISFSELPDGRFYNAAFQGYSGKLIAQQFQNDIRAFILAAKSSGGQALAETSGIGDAALAFKILPYVDLAVVYWLGDEDFPASCQVLFDASAPHHLSTDGCAILGSILTQRIIKVTGED
jgi:hypothetical protein